MSNSTFTHHDLKLLNPSFDSSLVDILTELEHLRRYRLDDGSTPTYIFNELRDIFHILESLSSARIEGNHTTLADYVESKLEDQPQPSDQIAEIANIERAMKFIEEIIKPGDPITEYLIRELHAITVNSLIREGDKTPGAYRLGPVRISGADHLPPLAHDVPLYMEELVNFVNQDNPSKYDLMKVALAHHRFGWIHPFGNGNGRVVRLFTYTLLIKYGFNVTTGGGILNPTAVFCNDRNKYYEMLSIADKGDAESLELWCTYVLEGILTELKKIDQLNEYDWLKKKILSPALQIAIERQRVTDFEAQIIRYGIDHPEFKAADLDNIFKDSTRTQRTYQIRKLNEAKLIQPITQGSRSYYVCFLHNSLFRGVIECLRKEGFISKPLEG
ncbi:Fic family protein [Acinetobacter sp. ANC 3813]|uniref:Fic family protein n=1 Tax=Acinetobacter sp. ANC 3813 TaxID=1977873 RepID=UPI000A32B603|nr:Fic family protein [Acinetobacter sp. ANC 3813]OTG86546.1 cell filamentation protein Fic [Acinetobacter sp. ANC 3813]